MVLINYAGREINAKIVYYGPGLSGKTTNLECIYASVPGDSRGKMVSMKTRQDRTLFFDFLPLELGEIHGFRTRFLLYTVPGQVFYNATRKLVLKGADAVVFVADSTQGKMEDNLQSLQNLEENLRENNLSLDGIPWVIQYNKRDLPNVFSVDELQRALNPQGVPHFEAAASTGRGVYETLHAVSRLLFQRLRSEFGRHAGSSRSGEAPNAPGAPTGAGTSRPTSGVMPTPASRPTSGAWSASSAAASGPNSLAAMQRPSQVMERPAAPPGPQAEGQPVPEYGRTIELPENFRPKEASMEGFIRDPMRRREGSEETKSVPGSPVRQVRVPVVIKASDLKPGGSVQIVLDVRVEP
jgi:signal recognition particle receptor subunit beta